MKSDEAENCLKSGEADEFFPRRRNFKQKVRNLYKALDFFGYFFFTPSLLGKVGMGQKKSNERSENSSNKSNSQGSIKKTLCNIS